MERGLPPQPEQGAFFSGTVGWKPIGSVICEGYWVNYGVDPEF